MLWGSRGAPRSHGHGVAGLGSRSCGAQRSRCTRGNAGHVSVCGTVSGGRRERKRAQSSSVWYGGELQRTPPCYLKPRCSMNGRLRGAQQVHPKTARLGTAPPAAPLPRSTTGPTFLPYTHHEPCWQEAARKRRMQPMARAWGMQVCRCLQPWPGSSWVLSCGWLQG